MTLTIDVKFEGTMTGRLKNYQRNLVNFHVSSLKSENVLLLSITYKVLDEKGQKSCVS